MTTPVAWSMKTPLPIVAPGWMSTQAFASAPLQQQACGVSPDHPCLPTVCACAEPQEALEVAEHGEQLWSSWIRFHPGEQARRALGLVG